MNVWARCECSVYVDTLCDSVVCMCVCVYVVCIDDCVHGDRWGCGPWDVCEYRVCVNVECVCVNNV